MDKQNSEIRIELDFDYSISALGGRAAGLKCYNEQLKDKVEKNINTEGVRFIIVFPENIKCISASYLLAMFDPINNIIGIDGIMKKFVFESSTVQSLENIFDELKLIK